MAPKYTVFRKPDGTHSATFDTTFERFFANNCTAIYTGVAGNQTRKLIRELNRQKPTPRQNPEPLKSTPTLRFESMDISSGLGIGGVGSDDFNINTENNLPSSGSAGCKWEHGTRYDENCESCGRYSLEVCNDCGCCERCHGE